MSNAVTGVRGAFGHKAHRALLSRQRTSYLAIHAECQSHPELERFAEACVQSGRYSSVSEVTRSAMRLLQETEACRAAPLASLQRAEAEGECEGFITADEVAADVRSVLDGAATQRA